MLRRSSLPPVRFGAPAPLRRGVLLASCAFSASSRATRARSRPPLRASAVCSAVPPPLVAPVLPSPSPRWGGCSCCGAPRGFACASALRRCLAAARSACRGGALPVASGLARPRSVPLRLALRRCGGGLPRAVGLSAALLAALRQGCHGLRAVSGACPCLARCVRRLVPRAARGALLRCAPSAAASGFGCALPPLLPPAALRLPRRVAAAPRLRRLISAAPRARGALARFARCLCCGWLRHFCRRLPPSGAGKRKRRGTFPRQD